MTYFLHRGPLSDFGEISIKNVDCVVARAEVLDEMTRRASVRTNEFEFELLDGDLIVDSSSHRERHPVLLALARIEHAAECVEYGRRKIAHERRRCRLHRRHSHRKC